MKVLLVTNQLADKKDGKVFVIENTYYIIKRFAQLGDITLLCNSARDISLNMAIENIPESRCFFIKKNRVFVPASDKKEIEKLVNENDLIIGYVPCVNAEYALSYASRIGKNTLSYVVGCTWDALWNHSLGGKIVAPIDYIRLKRVVFNSSYALYVTTQFLQKRYPCHGLTAGVSDVVIPDLNKQALEERLEKISRRSESDKITLCTVAGVNVRYKGQQFVIKALSKLKKQGDLRFHYYLYGEGDSSYLKSICKKYNVEELVHFEGRVIHQDIFDKLKEHDVYIQPSLQEGLPRSLVEAMSMGMLCIGAATGGIPELLDSFWITRRKSVSDIMDRLLKINKSNLEEQAEVNYNKAYAFQAAELDEKRIRFFDEVKNTMKD